MTEKRGEVYGQRRIRDLVSGLLMKLLRVVRDIFHIDGVSKIRRDFGGGTATSLR